MSKLSLLDFCILDAMAVGSEPFSMIYQELLSYGRLEWDMGLIAHSTCNLVLSGMPEICGIEARNKSDLNPTTLLEHYKFLDKELQEVGTPFYYSRGEYFFQMTEAGKEEWQKDEYQPFYTT